jgi:GNAT superfamily N-acetyltransferase
LWSADVLEELERNLLERGLPEDAVMYWIREMRRSFPDVERRGGFPWFGLFASLAVSTCDAAAVLLGTALGTMRQLFEPYGDRLRDRPDPPPALPRFGLPVPPPPEGDEISTLETAGEISALETDYVAAVEDLAERRQSIIKQTSDLPLSGGGRGSQDEMRIYEVPGSGPVIEAFYRQILQPTFPADELIDLDELQTIAASDTGSVWLAEAEDGTILAGAVAEWDESVRVVLLGYIAVRPGIRGGGIGGPLYLAALESWRRRFRPCLVLAEIEDPAVRSGSEDHGDSVARLRFFLSRGSRVLDFPYFQPALAPGSNRVWGLLLIVLHADPAFAGADDDTIVAGVVRKYLENYQIQYEGKVATDDQGMEMWRALDRPGGVHLRDQ